MDADTDVHGGAAAFVGRLIAESAASRARMCAATMPPSDQLPMWTTIFAAMANEAANTLGTPAAASLLHVTLAALDARQVGEQTAEAQELLDATVADFPAGPTH